MNRIHGQMRCNVLFILFLLLPSGLLFAHKAKSNPDFSEILEKQNAILDSIDQQLIKTWQKPEPSTWPAYFGLILAIIVPLGSIWIGYYISSKSESRRFRLEQIKGMITALSLLRKGLHILQNELIGIDYLVGEQSIIGLQHPVSELSNWGKIVPVLSDLKKQLGTATTKLSAAESRNLEEIGKKLTPMLEDVDYFNKMIMEMEHKMLEYYYYLPHKLATMYGEFTRLLAAKSEDNFSGLDITEIIAEIDQLKDLGLLESGMGGKETKAT